MRLARAGVSRERRLVPMQSVTELILPRLAIDDPEFAKDPFSRFAEARRQHSWLAKSDFGFVITGYVEIRDMLSMDDKFRQPHAGVVDIMKAQGTKWGDFQVNTFHAHSGGKHDRIREVVAPMFTPRAANENRWLMR